MKTIHSPETSKKHFAKRAAGYNASARWVKDKALIETMAKLAAPKKNYLLLDLAVGTGMIAGAFKGRVKAVVGLDLSSEMCALSGHKADCLVFGRGEAMPFADNSFDLVTCRQGLQFMELKKALEEIHRVLKPGGKAVLCHLTSYGGDDDVPAFEIQKLRNPARKNFFSPGDLELSAKKMFRVVKTVEYITRESVANWMSNGAVSAGALKQVLAVYKSSGDKLSNRRKVMLKAGDAIDSMRMEIVSAVK